MNPIEQHAEMFADTLRRAGIDPTRADAEARELRRWMEIAPNGNDVLLTGPTRPDLLMPVGRAAVADYASRRVEAIQAERWGDDPALFVVTYLTNNGVPQADAETLTANRISRSAADGSIRVNLGQGQVVVSVREIDGRGPEARDVPAVGSLCNALLAAWERERDREANPPVPLPALRGIEARMYTM